MLSFWRFATATAIGIVPASFLLTHFGDELATGEIEKICYAVLALGAITLVSVLARYFCLSRRDPNWKRLMRKHSYQCKMVAIKFGMPLDVPVTGRPISPP